MALGVKRKWKKRKDGSKDYPGQPETARMHEIHHVMQNGFGRLDQSSFEGFVPTTRCGTGSYSGKDTP
jgi:hypothetical protein